MLSDKLEDEMADQEKKFVLNMNKSAEKIKLCLQKKGIVVPPVVDVAFNLDVSGSFSNEHSNGLTTRLLERLVPWGLVFDPDNKLDMFTFSDGKSHAHYVGEVNEDNCDNYVRKNIINKVPGWNGGTHYVHVIKKNLIHFGWLANEDPVQKDSEKSGGFFSKMFSKKAETVNPIQQKSVKKKSIIIHVTDGRNDVDGPRDRAETTDLLKKMEAEKMEVYILFIAVSIREKDFSFLEEVADRFSNTGLYIIEDIKDFVEKDDEQLNEILIQQELIDWLKK